MNRVAAGHRSPVVRADGIHRFQPAVNKESREDPSRSPIALSDSRVSGLGSASRHRFRDALDLVVLVVGIDLIKIMALAKDVLGGQ